MSGILRKAKSRARLPCGVRNAVQIPATMPTNSAAAVKTLLVRKSLNAITALVDAGRSTCISEKVCARVGTMLVIMRYPTPTIASTMIEGYIKAPRIFFLRSYMRSI